MSADDQVTITALIPTSPVKADQPSALRVVSKVGIALDGVPVFSDAPPIQATGHMPALDPCGGHIDPGGWYHWHANSSDINTLFEKASVDASCNKAQRAGGVFGYAFDGFAMLGSQEPDGSTPEGLDECRGHVGVTHSGQDAVYHYHTGTEFPNLPGCISGVVAQNNFITTAQIGVGANPPPGTVITRTNPPRPDRGSPGGGNPGGGMPPGFAEAAQTLDVAPELLWQVIWCGPPRKAF